MSKLCWDFPPSPGSPEGTVPSQHTYSPVSGSWDCHHTDQACCQLNAWNDHKYVELILEGFLFETTEGRKWMRYVVLVLSILQSNSQSTLRHVCHVPQLVLIVSFSDSQVDLASLCIKAGVKNVGTMFLMTDAQVADERFLVLVNDLLASGNNTSDECICSVLECMNIEVNLFWRLWFWRDFPVTSGFPGHEAFLWINGVLLDIQAWELLVMLTFYRWSKLLHSSSC